MLQERFRSYWGISSAVVESVAERAAHFDADAVVGVGLDVLPYLGGVRGRVRIWYAADEWVLHHLSQFRVTERRTYGELRTAFIKGMYERAFAPIIDRAWVVSPTEQRAMRRYAGIRNVDVLPNGVDAEYFAPTAAIAAPTSAVFWGRLDFGPNLQALEWFCERVWPRVRERVPSARLTVVGFNAVPEVRARGGRDGIELRTDVPDIRPLVAESEIAILPMISGGGIKNKLLEAAALGKAIICTTTACGGLRATPPAIIVDGERDWVEALVSLWQQHGERLRLERAARAWIVEHHTWEAAAREALAGLQASVAERGHAVPAASAIVN
jgi:glycosyltransferase involved in cell wall biosynthesis